MAEFRKAFAWVLALVMALSCVPGFALTASAEETAAPEAIEEVLEPTEEIIEIVETEEEPAEEPAPPEEAPEQELVIPASEDTPELASQDQGWSFDETTGTLTITSTDSITTWSYGGQPWAAHRADIRKVTIGDGITSIGPYAFAGCESLTSVSLPDSVAYLGAYAFYNCGILTGVTLPASLASIEDSLFCKCESLTQITIPQGVTRIGAYAFKDCYGLENVQIPASVTAIGSSAFNNCSALAAISLPDGLTALGSAAFAGCTALTKIAIPTGVTQIPDGLFQDCVELAEVSLPEGITSIGQSAFFGCSSLAEILLPSTVRSIEYRAFTDCISLTQIRFTGDAPYIQEKAFEGLVTTCVYPADNATWGPSVMKDYSGLIEWVPDSVGVVPIPQKPYKIANVISGVRLYWKGSSSIRTYGVWRSVSGADGGYKLIDTTTATNYLDTTAQSGTTYHYKLTGIDTSTGIHSEKTESLGIIFVGTPDLTTRANRAAGIGLGWPRISGASGYAVYRKTYSGGDPWVRVATIADGDTTAWNDTSVRNNNGTVYRYTVRALAGEDLKTLSGCHGNGRTMVRLTSRQMTGASVVDGNSIRCTWTTTAQANGYEVRFMVGSEIYATYTIGNYKTGAKTFWSLRSGQTYKIQVRSYKSVSGVGTFYSAWSTPLFVELPQL